MLGWLLITVAGVSVTSTVNDRLTVDFSLPGQPGTDTADADHQAYGNGGNTVPLLVTITMPDGQTVTGSEAPIADAFATVSEADVPLRVIDEANTGDDAFRTDDDAHGVRDGLLPVPGQLRERAADRRGQGVRAGCGSRRRQGRRDRHGRARGRRRGGRQQRARRDAVRRTRGAGRAPVRLRVLPGLHAAADRGGLDPHDVPAAASDHLCDRRVLHRRVPDRPGRARRRDRLLAAPRDPMARGARQGQGQPRGRGRRDGDRRPRRAVQRHHRRHRPARAGRAARCRSCAASGTAAR